jgi:hypothetical protein
MQVKQPTTPDPIAADAPQVAHSTVKPSPEPEGFDLAWHYEMSSGEQTSSGQGFTRATVKLDGSAQHQEHATENLEAKAGASVTGSSIPSTAPKNEAQADANRKIHSNGGPAATLDGKPNSSKASRGTRIPGAHDGTADATSQDVPAAGPADVTGRCTAECAVTAVHQPGAAADSVAIGSHAIQDTSLESERDRPSIGAGIAKDTTAHPLQAADQNTGEPSKKLVMAAANQGAGERQVSGPPDATLSAGAPTSHVSAQTVALVSPTHMNSAILLAGQDLASSHPATPSTRPESRLETAALAQGPERSGHQVLASSPTQLDVGVFDGTHGWLRIRAELSNGGTVSASLTASATAYGPLRAALPEMANYLQAEAVSVDKIAVHRIADHPGAMSAAAAESQQNGSAGGHGSGQDPAQANAGTPRSPSGQRSALAAAGGSWMGGLSLSVPRFAGPFGLIGGNCGTWLNVCA